MITSLDNCNVVITGGLKKMTRDKAYALIRAEGGFPRKKVSGNTDILIISDDQARAFRHTEKYRKAQELWIDTITESDFYDIVGVQ